MNNNSEHTTNCELIFTTETLLKILDAVDSMNAIHETEEFDKLNKLYELTVESFQELSTNTSTETVDYISQTLPGDLRSGLNYIEANYRDDLRPKIITILSRLNDSLGDTSIPADTDNISESIGEIVGDFIQQTDISEDAIPKSLQDLQKHPSEKAIFVFNFNHNTDILSVNGIQVSQLKSTTDRFNEILTNAMNHPGEPVKSDSRMSSFIYDLKGIPKPLKDLFFPVRGKHKFILIPEVTKKMLDDKNLDAETLTKELIELNRTK